jgi:hypothetical protein
MPRSKPVDDRLARLAAAEDRFLESEFLAPAPGGGIVRVRVAGVVCRLSIQPPDFEGWAVFRPTSLSAARVVRPARLVERQSYLKLFPLVRLIVAARTQDQWLGIPAHGADSRFRIEGMVPIRLIEDARQFEIVQTRFDGTQFWYSGVDSRGNPARAAYLREALEKMVPPAGLKRSGLTTEERRAYAASYEPRFQASEEARRGREEKRLQDALAHAGAELKDYVERMDAYTITFDVDGQRHVSVVTKSGLGVQVAGICLSGRDQEFDLQSLVGVVRQARGRVVRVGWENQGMAEEHYWRAHPRP